MKIIKEEINRIREIMSLPLLKEDETLTTGTTTQVEIIMDSDVESILQGKNILKRGHKGKLVSNIQQKLVVDYNIDLGEYGKLKDGVDGVFGSKTKEGVKEFQKTFNLVVDGIVGPCTLDTIINGVANKCCESGKCKTEECKDTNFCPAKKNIKSQKTNTNTKKNEREVENVKVNKKLPRKFELIPGGAGNYRTGQPSLGQLKYILQDEFPEIQRVVRMNGSREVSVSIEKEKELVEGLGKEFIWINAHKGYRRGEGYVDSMNVVIPLLMEGNTLIHCTAGKDRTGFMVARYLKDIGYNNWSDEDLWDYTVDFNSWERKGYICNNTDYKKYMEGFYTINDWCSANSERRSCRVCRG
jgi:peptidoglycan hydrolase-like protein with peptidoglycan-binding domain